MPLNFKKKASLNVQTVVGYNQDNMEKSKEAAGSNINMDGNINETVEELKAKLDAMKDLLAEEQLKQALLNKRHTGSGVQFTSSRRESLIDGTFLSAVFAVVFLLIVGVSFYAFQNLYFAILKRFPAKHTEL